MLKLWPWNENRIGALYASGIVPDPLGVVKDCSKGPSTGPLSA